MKNEKDVQKQLNLIPKKEVKMEFSSSVFKENSKKFVRLTKPWLYFAISLLIALAFIFPFYILLVNAFKSNPEITANRMALPTKLRFDNFTNAIEETSFWQSMTNSLVITIVSNILIILISSAGAWMIVRSKNKYGKFVYALFLLSLIIPFQILMIPLVWWTELIGLSGITGIIIIYIGFGIPFTVFLLRSFIMGIPISLEEAAKVDGANVIKIFFKIVLPLLKPILVTVLILNTMWIWNDFLLPLLILYEPETFTIPLAINQLRGTFGTNYPLLIASLLLSVIPAIIFFLFSQKGIIRGISSGAIK